jgi:hypothetical protein
MAQGSRQQLAAMGLLQGSTGQHLQLSPMGVQLPLMGSRQRRHRHQLPRRQQPQQPTSTRVMAPPSSSHRQGLGLQRPTPMALHMVPRGLIPLQQRPLQVLLVPRVTPVGALLGTAMGQPPPTSSSRQQLGNTAQQRALMAARRGQLPAVQGTPTAPTPSSSTAVQQQRMVQQQAGQAPRHRLYRRRTDAAVLTAQQGVLGRVAPLPPGRVLLVAGMLPCMVRALGAPQRLPAVPPPGQALQALQAVHVAVRCHGGEALGVVLEGPAAVRLQAPLRHVEGQGWPLPPACTVGHPQPAPPPMPVLQPQPRLQPLQPWPPLLRQRRLSTGGGGAALSAHGLG